MRASMTSPGEPRLDLTRGVFRVLNMQASVQFYRNVLGMELLYGGEQASFSSLRANDSESAILNLERGDTVFRPVGPGDFRR
jgi:catechol 2,3-dioxygenase-like lactoylglutathione lyase family enzyme